MKFAIYDKLIDITCDTVDWQNLCNTINNLPLEHSEIIDALIIHFYLNDMQTKCPNTNLNSLIAQLKEYGDQRKINLQQPYGVRTIGVRKGAMYTVNHLPEKLQNLIANYVFKITKI